MRAAGCTRTSPGPTARAEPEVGLVTDHVAFFNAAGRDRGRRRARAAGLDAVGRGGLVASRPRDGGGASQQRARPQGLSPFEVELAVDAGEGASPPSPWSRTAPVAISRLVLPRPRAWRRGARSGQRIDPLTARRRGRAPEAAAHRLPAQQAVRRRTRRPRPSPAPGTRGSRAAVQSRRRAEPRSHRAWARSSFQGVPSSSATASPSPSIAPRRSRSSANARVAVAIDFGVSHASASSSSAAASSRAPSRSPSATRACAQAERHDGLGRFSFHNR